MFLMFFNVAFFMLTIAAHVNLKLKVINNPTAIQAQTELKNAKHELSIHVEYFPIRKSNTASGVAS